MSLFAPLAMSEKKQTLVVHLNMAPETYNLMGKEVDQIYCWLVEDKRHLKSNCKRKPPYDWSDMSERAKDEAIRSITQAQDSRTRRYWDLAQPTEECINWIARWFLYHKFRYRDGRSRNRGSSKNGDGSSKHYAESSQPEYYETGQSGGYHQPSESSTHYESSQSSTYYESSQSSTYHDASQASAYYTTVVQSEGTGQGVYYDPVRDV